MQQREARTWGTEECDSQAMWERYPFRPGPPKWAPRTGAPLQRWGEASEAKLSTGVKLTPSHQPGVPRASTTSFD